MQNEKYREGVALYKAKEYTKAAELLSEVVEQLAALHGDLAPECADAYFQYGRALLAEVEEREEREGGQDVLGGTVPKEVPTGVAPDSEGGTQDGAASGQVPKGKDEEGEDEGDEGDEDEDEEEDEGEEEGQEGEEGSADGAASGKAPADGSQEGGDSDAPELSDDPMQLAWEVLDVARKIYEQEDPCADPLRLADIYAHLGDINLRNEQFDASRADYEACLALRAETCKPDDRLLIEIHHLLAMVAINHTTPDRPAAIRSYKEAVRICELRVSNLDRLMALPDPADPHASVPESSVHPQSKGSAERERNEIDAIADEMRARVEAEEEIGEGAAGSASGASASGASAAAANPFGAEALKALAASAGMGSSASVGTFGPGLAGVDAAVPVKTLGVFGKKKKREADAEAAASDKTPADAKKAKTDASPPSDRKASAAPTPARAEPIVETS